jgi:transcriptional regulator with XRE-family HTH domain
MTQSDDFPDRLRAAIQLSGLNQNEVAYRLSTAPARISEWCNGRSMPDFRFLSMLPEALNVSGHWLLTGEGPMPLEATSRQSGHLELLLRIARLCQEGIETSNEARDAVQAAETLLTKEAS